LKEKKLIGEEKVKEILRDIAY